MLSLTKELEHEFIFQGRKYELDLSFDNVLRWYEMCADEEIENEEKVMRGFEMFFKACPLDADLLIDGVQAVEEYIQQSAYGHKETEGDDNPPDPIKYYSYQQDAEAIYSSILAQYHIDLVDQQGILHWDKFKALLLGLDDNTIFKRIIDIRRRPIKSDMDPDEISQLNNLKDYYWLEANDSVDSQNEAMQTQFNDVGRALKAWAQG